MNGLQTHAFIKYIIQETTYQQLHAIMHAELISPTFKQKWKVQNSLRLTIVFSNYMYIWTAVKHNSTHWTSDSLYSYNITPALNSISTTAVWPFAASKNHNSGVCNIERDVHPYTPTSPYAVQQTSNHIIISRLLLLHCQFEFKNHWLVPLVHH